MVDRALSFGSFAAAYERFRPGYPDEVADRIIAFAGRPLRTALEIGAGTGKATRLLAARGIAVKATEPDRAMLDELRKHVPDSVVTICATFEEVPPGTYDLVVAAASLHWTEREGRWDRVSALLPPGGVFASFGGPLWLADPELEEAARAARSGVLGSDDVPEAYDTAVDAPMQWPGTELEAAPAFTDVEQHVLPRRTTMPAEEWIGHLSTVSAYLVLSDEDRAEAFHRLRAVLPDHVEVAGDVVLHLARRI